MSNPNTQTVNRCIRDAARLAAAGDSLIPYHIAQFLRTGEEHWPGSLSSSHGPYSLKSDGSYSNAAKTALLTLFDQLSGSLPDPIRTAPQVSSEEIRQRIEPMIRGLVQHDWQEIALAELTRRTFVLNYHGAKAAIAAELSTGWRDTAWQVLWAFSEEHGLTRAGTRTEYDGLSGGEYAHVLWSAYQTTDPYSDVVVHEAAHLLHYLKPEHYGLHIRRGQERFVDVDFHSRELFAFTCEAYSRALLWREPRSRVSFAEKMLTGAVTFPKDELAEISALVESASRSRNGWRIIRDATVAPRSMSASRAIPCRCAD